MRRTEEDTRKRSVSKRELKLNIDSADWLLNSQIKL
jgi:hypothetical protein